MSGGLSWRIVHSEASCGWGGQEHRVLAELRGFQRRGCWVALLAPPHSEIFKRGEAGGIVVHPLDTRKSRYLPNAFRIRGWLRRNRVQVVNTHSSRDGYLVGAAARLARVPLQIRSRHIDVSYRNPWISRLAFSSFADHVMTTSGKITAHLQDTFHLPDDRISTVSTGVDTDRFSPDGTAADLSVAVGVDDAPLVGMVSVLRSWKGHLDFLKAARMLKDRGVSARYMIVGEGPQRANIERVISELGLQENVTMLGHREDIPCILRTLDVVVIPSTGHEGIPQIGLQALASGTAVVGSDAGGIPEIIRDRQTGRIFHATDVEALAATVEATLTDSDATREYVAAGRDLVLAGHNIEHMLDRIEEIYRRHLPAGNIHEPV